MKRILIVGDSFAADWSKKYPDAIGWPNMLANEHKVTNLAQAGVGEYKIWKQLTSSKLSQYSHVIICHTSPYRIHTLNHPLHKNDKLHNHCDLIYEDIKDTLPDIANFFRSHFDLEYADFIHKLIIDKELSYVKDHPMVKHIGIHKLNINDYFNFHDIFKKHKGITNHLTDTGNYIIYKYLNDWLKL